MTEAIDPSDELAFIRATSVRSQVRLACMIRTWGKGDT